MLSFIQKGLQQQGMIVDSSSNGDEALALASATPYDLLVLDIMLPGRDGLSILRMLRDQHNDVPVILLTARSGLNERLDGLNAGADDYLSKPFYIEELIARINTVLRRSLGKSTNLLKVGPLTMNIAKREVHRDSRPIELTTREFALLEYLMRAPGNVLTRIQICEHVWDYKFDPNTNLVDVYIRRLRNKIDKDASDKLIKTVRGIGYRIIEP